MNEQLKFRFTAYVAGDPGASVFVNELRDALKSSFGPGEWELEIFNVLEVPEKALANDVFATPTLVRSFPEPVLKVLANAAQIREVLLAIVDMQSATGDLV